MDQKFERLLPFLPLWKKISFFSIKSITAIEFICIVPYLHEFSFGLIRFSFSKPSLVFLSNYRYCKFNKINLVKLFTI